MKMAGGFRNAQGLDAPVAGKSDLVGPDSMDTWQALLTGRGRYLDDATLIAAVVDIFTSQGSESKEIAHILTQRYGSLAALLCAPEQELAAIKRIGQHIIPALKLLHEAAIRYNKARLDRDDILSDEQKLLDYLTARLARENVEQFRILFLTEKRRLIADEAQARGTVNHTPVYPREVARRAMELDAHGLVLVHNHPSGDPSPSEADLMMTRHVQAAVEAIGLTILDHIIIGNGRHTSFRALDIL